MTQYNREELSLIFQVLAGILITMGAAYALSVYYGAISGLALIIGAVGLAIIIGCWVGIKHIGFMVTIILGAIIFAFSFNFGAMFH